MLLSVTVRAQNNNFQEKEVFLKDSLSQNKDSLLITPVSEEASEVIVFAPDPMKAVWYSALFPGLGQIYNRKYWKLPLVVGGYMGLTYGLSWITGIIKIILRHIEMR